LASDCANSANPTLKRGANEPCASGALWRTNLMQLSIRPTSFYAVYGTAEAVPFQNIDLIRASLEGGARIVGTDSAS